MCYRHRTKKGKKNLPESNPGTHARSCNATQMKNTAVLLEEKAHSKLERILAARKVRGPKAGLIVASNAQ